MKLRRLKIVRSVIRFLWGGTKCIKYPHSNFMLYLDGYKNIGIIARGVEESEKEEKFEIERVLQNIRPSCIWDIGANIGTWSMFLSTLHPVARVCCFEPDPEKVKYLSMNKVKNQIDFWTIYPVALSNAVGEMQFHFDSTTGATGSLEPENLWTEKHFHTKTVKGKVAVSTIDTMIADGVPIPELIKCDVEGHELSVFQGGRMLLSDHHPVIFWEDSGKKETSCFLSSLGYRFFNMSGAPIPLPEWNTLAVHTSMTDVLGLRS